MKSYVGIVVVLGLVIPVTIWGSGQTARDFAPPVNVTPASNAQAGRGQAPLPRNARNLRVQDPRVELMTERIITVGASQSGMLTSVEPGRVGDMVQQNQIVARIRDNVMQAKQEAATQRAANEVEIQYAEAANKVAAVAFFAATQKRGAYSEAEYRNLELDYKKTMLQIEKAKKDKFLAGLEVKEFAAELANFEMAAPISGEIMEVMKKTGESVRQGDDILQIIDVSKIVIWGAIPFTELPNVSKGTQVLVRIPGNNGVFQNVFKGKVTFIKKEVSPLKQTVEVRAVVDNQADANGNFILKAGLNVQMDLILGNGGVDRRQP